MATAEEHRVETFVSERIEPIGFFDISAMSRGEPGLPQQFIWRGKTYLVAEVFESWRESGPCSHGSSEVYLRKHWFRVRTSDDIEMRIYFERQARSSSQAKQRWWLYSTSAAAGSARR